MGDLALSLVNGTVINDPLLSDAVKVRVVSEMIEMTRRTIEGQALDIGWARDGRYDITPEDYLVMATHKTAHYSGAVPLAIGAIVGGGTEQQIEALRSYGLDTGLAFQIQDDLLNLIGSEESTKKDFRSDITEGKRTLMVVHALQNSSKRERLIEILSSKEKDSAVLAEAVDIMVECRIHRVCAHLCGKPYEHRQESPGRPMIEPSRFAESCSSPWPIGSSTD